jgi:hypothetical protein
MGVERTILWETHGRDSSLLNEQINESFNYKCQQVSQKTDIMHFIGA